MIIHTIYNRYHGKALRVWHLQILWLILMAILTTYVNYWNVKLNWIQCIYIDQESNCFVINDGAYLFKINYAFVYLATKSITF